MCINMIYTTWKVDGAPPMYWFSMATNRHLLRVASHPLTGQSLDPVEKLAGSDFGKWFDFSGFERIFAPGILSTNYISKRLMVVLMGEFYVPAMHMDFRLVKYFFGMNPRECLHMFNLPGFANRLDLEMWKRSANGQHQHGAQLCGTMIATHENPKHHGIIQMHPSTPN